MRAATRQELNDFCSRTISIHAAHAGCDHTQTIPQCSRLHFNPRSPCGLRLALSLQLSLVFLFQSTQPMRAATRAPFVAGPVACKFQSTQPMRAATSTGLKKCQTHLISIHAAHAGCDCMTFSWHLLFPISIHAAHAGCDLTALSSAMGQTDFNPRSPCGLRQILLFHIV